MNWITPLLNDYHQWIKDNTLSQVDVVSGWATIQTPFLGAYNDNISIFAQQKGEHLLLSDDGITLNNLSLLGIKLNRGERKEITDKILFNYGISLDGKELTVACNAKDFPQKKHNLLSAIIELSDLSNVSTHHVAAIFKDDVRHFLDEQEIIFTPDFISKGTTGLEFTFDFQLTSRESELVIKSFNSLNTLNVPNFLFSWEDIKPVREKVTKKEVKAIAIINDLDKPAGAEYLEALTSKNASYLLWSERNSPAFKEALAA